jgi:hypothetical protein
MTSLSLDVPFGAAAAATGYDLPVRAFCPLYALISFITLIGKSCF